MGATVSIHATGVVVNEWKSGSGFAAVDAGDRFEFSVSYTDSLPDQSLGYNPGRIYPADLTATLQIIGKGTIFEAMGGIVSFATLCTSGPGGYCYPAIEVFCTSASGLGFQLLIADKNRSLPPTDTGWIDYDEIYEYESVDFFIRPPYPEVLLSGGLLSGSATSFTIPEPSSYSLIGLGLSIGSLIRRRHKSKKANKTVVATAGNVARSLRSVSPLSAVPHL